MVERKPGRIVTIKNTEALLDYIFRPVGYFCTELRRSTKVYSDKQAARMKEAYNSKSSEKRREIF